MNHILLASALTASFMATNSSLAQSPDIIDKTDYKSESGIFDIDALESLGRVGAPTISPNKQTILFGISYESVEQNKSNNDLYTIDIDGKNLKRITRTAESESNAVWIAKGTKIAFTAKGDNDKTQLWIMNADGTDRRQISHIEKGIEGFVFSPDETKVILISTVKFQRSAQDVYPDLPKANAHIIDDLMYKHWDEWVTEIPHPFLADFDGDILSNIEDILGDEPFEAPMRPFGGAESFAWSPDSKKLVYVSRKKTGLEYALSTDSGLYLYDTESKSTTLLTKGMNGYDTCPSFSPDGTQLAWLSMEHDGYESDKNRIMIMDFKSGIKTDLTDDWDYSADAIAWNVDGKSIYFIAPYLGTTPIFSVEVKSHKISIIDEGIYDYASLCPVDKNTLITLRHSMLCPNEIFKINKGKVDQLTFVNKEILDQLTLPTVEKRLMTTTDGQTMTTWIVLPPNFDASKKYPSILYCQGGPQSPVSQFWSYRWNFMLMASNGYVVIAPNRRGLPGFGTKWNEQISKDYPGQNMRDYITAADEMRKEPFIDNDRMGAVGASYGGFSVYWLAGNHNNRFACLIAHAGIFNMEAQYLETEEMWFANWDMGGAPWEWSNKIAQRTFRMSPHKFVDKWTAPILVTHGELDYRILASQGMMAFNAAKLRGIPAEMVVFPDENHWILKPQNAVLWQRVFFRWLDKWLKK